jgi:hypothetical protein
MMYVRSIAIDKRDDDGDDRGLAKNVGVNGVINALVDDGTVKPTNVRTIAKNERFFIIIYKSICIYVYKMDVKVICCCYSNDSSASEKS